MENIAEKIAYLKGLAEGLGVNEDTKEGRIISGILDILNDLNEYIGEIDDDLVSVEEAVDEINEDLTDIEDELYGEYDDEDCCNCDDCCDCEDDIYEIECPECGELVYADEETIEETDVYCPNCHKKLEIEIPEDEDFEDDEE